MPRIYVGTYNAYNEGSLKGAWLDLEDVKEAFMYLFDEWNEDRCRDSYIGAFDNRTKMAENFVDDTGLLDEIPENLRYYFDYEAYGRDMELGGDVFEHNRHWFWRNY